MIRKLHRTLRGGAMSLMYFLWTGVLLSAQTGQYSVAPQRDWVRPLPWEPTELPSANPQSEGARYLLYERQDNPREEEEFSRVILFMENESAVQDSGSLRFDFTPSHQDLILHHIRIHRNGTVMDRLDASKIRTIQQEPGLAGHIITGEQTAIVFVEDLRVGDALEYAFTVRGANPILAGHYATRFFVQGGTPVERQRMRVLWSGAQPLHVRQHLTEAVPEVNAWNGGQEYVWDFSILGAIPYEDYLPPSFEPYPYLELSDFEDWARVVEWALPLYRLPEDDLPPELEELVTRWQSEAVSSEDRARLALQFVQDELRYTGIELGPDSYRPTPPHETLALRYGDCKAKALLFCTLLDAMGIEAYPALVNTYVREAVARRLPSPFAFNHVIVKVLIDGRTVWVDPTMSRQGGRLWDRYLPPLGKALVLRTGVSALEDVPPPGTRQAYQRVNSTFRMTDYESPASFTVKTAYYGSEADDMREHLARTDAANMKQDYLNYYSRYYPGIQDGRPFEIQDDRELNVLTVTEFYQIRDLWEWDETEPQWVAHFYVENLEEALTDPGTRLRKMPLRIPHPLRREQETVVHLPDDEWHIPALEHEVKHPAFSFHYRRSFSGSTVRFEYECETHVPELPADQVPGYLRKLSEMEDLTGDVLYRSDDSPGSLLARINWLMVILGGFGAAAVLAGCLWFWYATRVPATPALSALPPPLPGQAHLRGLGGWLLLVGIGLCLGPITRVIPLAQNWESFFSIDVWQTVAVPRGEEFHPLFGPLLIYELLGNMLLLGMNILTIWLFFTKRRVFPKLFIAFMLSNVIFILIDEILGSQISFVAAQQDDSTIPEISRVFLGAVIWISYMLKSRRVKATFVR